MGQNFLIDKNILEKIVGAADIKPEDTIVEIGPGIGNLTQALASKAKKVISIEKDFVMLNILKETVGSHNNIELIQSDILKLSINNFQLSNYKVVANVPYYITSPIIRMFLETKNQPESIVLMIQKEVAQRICQAPPHMSLLAVSVQYYATAKIMGYVSKSCFWPSPNVDSAIINIIPSKRSREISDEAFFSIVKAGFSHPRKQLLNNLSKELGKDREAISAWLQKNNINPLQRAETLTVQDWFNLAKSK